MPLQPSRRDTKGALDVLRHHQSYLRSLGPGFLDGTRATPQPNPPGPSVLVGGDEDGGGGEDNALVGEDGDRLVLTSLGTQPWTLSYDPVPETIHLRWHPDGGAGVPWARGDQYTIDDDDRVVTITAETLAANGCEIGDVLSAQYLRAEGEQEAVADSAIEALSPRGFSLMVSMPTTIPLPTGTQVGDLIVALCATALNVSGGHGGGYIDDPRLTQVGYGMWAGIATDLNPVVYANPAGDRMAGAVGTFAAGVYPGAAGTTGPGPVGIASLAVPTPAGTAAVMGFIEENPNGFGGSLDSWPAGYVQGTLGSGATICKAYILYWPPDGTNAPPAGNVTYHAHSTSGASWVDVLALQGEEGE